MKRVVALFLCILMTAAICAVFPACSKKETGLRKIILNEVTRSVFYAPLYVAASRGYFEEEGLKLEIVTGGGSDASMTALLAGEADFALMGPETGVYVINEGKTEHPVIIGQLTKRDGSFLIGREKTDSFSWDMLRGKSVIGGRVGGMPYMTLMYVLNKHGLTPGEDVEVINNIQFNLMGGAFESGTGDYVTLFEPTATQFQNNGSGYIVANIGLESGEVPYTAFMTRPETIKNDPKLVTKFIRAIVKAQKWVETASDNEIAEAMLPYFPDSSVETLAIVAKSYRETDSWMKTPVMTEEAFSRLLDIMEFNGELKARVDFKELVDNSFAEKALNGSGK
ncbi:MAG: ABC transporter substrate-binding protein [Clostridiales bacterium]|nr:ABC transporter substrate-binding protein [Clostridiales bacterium]